MSRRGQVIAVVGALALVVCLPANIESARWWRSPHVCAELKLSTAQSQAIEQIYIEYVPAQSIRAGKAERARAVLDRMLVDDAPDVAMQQAIDAAAGAEAARWRGRMTMLSRIFRELSPAQRERLRTIARQQRLAAFHDIGD